jgi:hypothetical protein
MARPRQQGDRNSALRLRQLFAAGESSNLNQHVVFAAVFAEFACGYSSAGVCSFRNKVLQNVIIRNTGLVDDGMEWHN